MPVNIIYYNSTWENLYQIPSYKWNQTLYKYNLSGDAES